MVKGTHRGSVEDACVDGVGAETSRRATAPRREPPRGVGKRWRQSPSLTPRRSRRHSASAIALFLSKKGKHVRRGAAGLPRARRVHNATSRCNRLGSVVLTLRELRRITKNFSDDQLLGEGAFGKVYKGVLKNGDTIALKRFASTITGLQDGQYENEAEHLIRLKHPNIVQLVGYCSETEMKLVRHNGKFVRAEQPERLLCLEYMPNGSLSRHLSDESSGLDWKTRYKIIKGICYGLHYLHEEWQVTPIIHMDLKPANILLDDNMVPKIADFGLSRLFGEEQTRTCTTSRKGTPGYMAPEYLEKGVITKKFDIFSLGVIIIEIIAGHKNYPKETETTFQQYIDIVLNNWTHRSEDIDYQQINKCIQIGLLCVKFDGAKRPTIDQIIKMLEKRSNEAYKNESEVPEEAAKTITSFLSRAPSLCRTLVDQNQNQLPQRYKHSFVNALETEVLNKVICDIDGEPLTIRVICDSARQSWLRKQQLRLRKRQRLDELVQEVVRLQAENTRVAARATDVVSQYARVEQENTVLRAHAAELGDRLHSVNEVLRVFEEFSGVAMDIQGETMPDDDPLLRPWQLPYPAAMPIGAPHMLYY